MSVRVERRLRQTSVVMTLEVASCVVVSSGNLIVV